MKCIFVDTGEEVEVGDIVRYRNDFYKVVRTTEPEPGNHGHLGRVIIKSLINPFEKERVLVPHEVGAEWRADC